MKILELFSGTESFSKAARDRGHETFTIDNNPQFNPDLCKNILDVTPEDIPFRPDIIWASPPCQKFSVASVYRHWENGKPKYNGTYESLLIVAKTISLILALKPKFWIIENPRGMLRKQPMMLSLKRDTVTYCQYGLEYQKATDLWNNIDSWIPRPMCSPKSPCHVRSPRGSQKGIQGVGKNSTRANLIHPDWNYSVSRAATKRAIVPKELCLEIIKVCEDKMNENPTLKFKV